MPDAYQFSGISIGGVTIQRSNAIAYDTLGSPTVTLPALVAAQTNGSLTTRTDDNTGVVTLAAAHGILTADKVDVYWVGGVRYGMDATVSGTAVTVDAGAGDVLPAQDTAITAVAKQVNLDPLNIDGDNAAVIAIAYVNGIDQTAKAHADFQDSGSATIREVDFVTTSQYGWDSEVADITGGDTNNYTGNPITKGFFSHDSVNAAKIYILVGLIATQ